MKKPLVSLRVPRNFLVFFLSLAILCFSAFLVKKEKEGSANEALPAFAQSVEREEKNSTIEDFLEKLFSKGQ